MYTTKKDLLKTQDGFDATMARTIDSITAVVHAIKQADDGGRSLKYSDLERVVQRQIDEVDYNADFDNRPMFQFACFLAGTLIHTEQGLVPIEQIKVGDRVLSKDESGEGELVYKPVVRTVKTENIPIVKSI